MIGRAVAADVDQHIDAVALDDRRQGEGVALADVAPLAGAVPEPGVDRVLGRPVAVEGRFDAPGIHGLGDGLQHGEIADVADRRNQKADIDGGRRERLGGRQRLGGQDGGQDGGQGGGALGEPSRVEPGLEDGVAQKGATYLGIVGSRGLGLLVVALGEAGLAESAVGRAPQAGVGGFFLVAGRQLRKHGQGLPRLAGREQAAGQTAQGGGLARKEHQMPLVEIRRRPVGPGQLQGFR